VPDDPAELVEFAWTPTTGPLGPGPDGPAVRAGVGQLVVQPWGFVVCPLDERMTWIHFRRASIATVKPAGPGEVVVDGDPGTLILRGSGGRSHADARHAGRSCATAPSPTPPASWIS
jgi:hypothetical protein